MSLDAFLRGAPRPNPRRPSRPPAAPLPASVPLARLSDGAPFELPGGQRGVLLDVGVPGIGDLDLAAPLHLTRSGEGRWEVVGSRLDGGPARLEASFVRVGDPQAGASIVGLSPAIGSRAEGPHVLTVAYILFAPTVDPTAPRVRLPESAVRAFLLTTAAAGGSWASRVQHAVQVACEGGFDRPVRLWDPRDGQEHLVPPETLAVPWPLDLPLGTPCDLGPPPPARWARGGWALTPQGQRFRIVSLQPVALSVGLWALLASGEPAGPGHRVPLTWMRVFDEGETVADVKVWEQGRPKV